MQPEVVDRRPAAAVLAHDPAGHRLEVVLPAGAHLQRGVVDDDALARGDEVVQRLLGTRPPALLGRAAPRLEPAEVVEDDEVVLVERLRAGPAELLGDPDVEQPGLLEQVPQHRRDGPPVVVDVGVPGDDQRLELVVVLEHPLADVRHARSPSSSSFRDRAQLALHEVAGQQRAGGGVRALVALDDDPARVAGVQQRAGDRREVDESAVGARLGEPARDLAGAAPHADRPVRVRLQVLLGVVDGEGVLELHVRDAVGVPLDDGERVDASRGQLAGVEGEADERRIGAVEQRGDVVAAQGREEVHVQRESDTVLRRRPADRLPARGEPAERVVVQRLDVTGARRRPDQQHRAAELGQRLGVPARLLARSRGRRRPTAATAAR